MLDEKEFSRWMRSSKRTLSSADRDRGSGDYNWSCFKAHQAAEFAVKALLRGLGLHAYGHSVSGLLSRLEGMLEVSGEVMSDAKALDKLYVPTRYPNAWAEGSPEDYYTANDSQNAIKSAENIIRWVESSWKSLRRGKNKRES